MSLLVEAIIFLTAAIIAVPITRKLGFGSVLGYLGAGIIIGPYGLALIGDAEHLMHFAELGVVFLLFIIGLELQPSRLWVLRRMVFGLGASQVFISGVVIALLAWAAGLSPTTAIVVGLALALSSTAFVLQMLAEKKQLTTSYGRASFSILLFQDLAVIPLIAIMPILGTRADGAGIDVQALLISAAALVGLIVGGRFLLRPVLRIVAATAIPELFTAVALLVVIGSALLMQAAGMSMVLGAFIAGMLLADSEYRHELEGDIAPFKGLLLGLFFIAVGMSVNLGLLGDIPGEILAIVAVLMLAKALVLVPLARAYGMCDLKNSFRVAAAMSQGGEFAFVLFGLAVREGIIDVPLNQKLTLAVTVSMLLTPFLYTLAERVTDRMRETAEPEYDSPSEQHNDIIIAGLGRVGQVVSRLLRIVGKPFTALEADPRQVDLVRRYGNDVHYGDATRLDLLRAAGAAHAKIMVITLSDMEASVRLAQIVRRNFPHLKIVARARNRRHAHKLMDVGVDHVFRDTLLSSVAMGKVVLGNIGLEQDEIDEIAEMFVETDERLLRQQHAVHDQEEELIQSAKETARELESLFRNDRRMNKNA
ncbi:MAG: monovalent cation:proton antiporter-2 (CPA2) family protein [Woeseiaceae bacterium]|nr:monovalent cation:proton antiporter-2 (CPA2) family protein [Woeseiaceae bacterium]